MGEGCGRSKVERKWSSMDRGAVGCGGEGGGAGSGGEGRLLSGAMGEKTEMGEKAEMRG